MRAVTIRDTKLSVEDHPDPEPGAGECLIRVRAAGLNGADMMQLRGHYPAPPGVPQEIPGLELAGERLLVHGGAGGVGTAAIQLGHTAGARVTATVRNPDSREAVAALGADVIEPDGFAEHGPFDVILELIGGPNLPEDLAALNIQ